MNISNIPNEIILNILYNLNYKDLYNVSLVCKNWNKLCDDEMLWKNNCLSYIDYLEPTYQSYKKRFNVIANMIESRYLTTFYNDCNYDIKMNYKMLSKKGDILKICVDRNNKKINIKNISSDIIDKKFFVLNDLDREADIILCHLSETKFIILDNFGTIYVYSNESFELITIIKLNCFILSKTSEIALYHNEYMNEIILCVNRKINIINTIKCNLKLSLDVSNIIINLVGITAIKSTENYVIFQTHNYEKPEEKTYIINKNSSIIEELMIPSSSVASYGFDTYKEYLVIVTLENKIRIYVDENINLKLKKEINLLYESMYDPSLKINNGLLYISHVKKLYILKIKTGEIISSIKHDYRLSSITTNGYYLLVSGLVEGRFSYFDNSYTLYDYTSYNPTNNQSSFLSSSSCIIL